MNESWPVRILRVLLVLSLPVGVVALVEWQVLSRDRHASLRTWNEARCGAFMRRMPDAQDPCGPERLGPSTAEELRAGRVDIEAARAAAERGDRQRAAAALAASLSRSRRMERRSTTFATMMAATLVRDVLDVLEAHPSLATDPALRESLLKGALASAERPLESERLWVISSALAGPPRSTLAIWDTTTGREVDVAEREDAILAQMEIALRAGDVEACHRAAARGDALFGVPLRHVLCTKMIDVVSTARRLARYAPRQLARPRAVTPLPVRTGWLRSYVGTFPGGAAGPGGPAKGGPAGS
jgi:hypothetical protein